MTLKASNTNTTLAPKSIFEAAGVQETETFTGREQAPTLNDTEAVYGEPLDNLRKLMAGDLESLPKNDDCFAYYDYKPGSDQSEYGRRLQKLEEQMDGLLDRLARYNQRAQHRI